MFYVNKKFIFSVKINSLKLDFINKIRPGKDQVQDRNNKVPVP